MDEQSTNLACYPLEQFFGLLTSEDGGWRMIELLFKVL